MNNKRKSSKFDDVAKIAKHSTTDADGEDYHTIADVMSEIGYPMEHSTARNVFLSAMRKFATEIGNGYSKKVDVDLVCLDPAFHEVVRDLIESVDID